MADIDKKQEMSGRRRFLIAATSVAGGIATVAVATPFVMSMMPSERAKAAGAPVEVDISKIEPGKMITWNGVARWCGYWTARPRCWPHLPKLDSQVADPKSEKPQQPAYCKNETRSINRAILVVVGICTHLGCSPVYPPGNRAPRTSAPTGWAVFSARATDPSSTSRAACTRACRRRRIWSSRRTSI